MRAWLKEWWVLLMMISAAVALSVGMCYITYLKAVEWTAFSKEHNCIIVEKKEGSVYAIPSVAVSGNTATPVMSMVVESDKTAYKCDDGVTYWR